MTIDQLLERIGRINKEHGWDSTVTEEAPSIFGEKLMLVCTELAEAMEAFREHHTLSEIWRATDGKPEGIPIELADAIIRILDLCHANQIDIVYALEAKLSYNATRSFRHGNKRA